MTHHPLRVRAGVVAAALIAALAALVPIADPVHAADTPDFGDLDAPPRSVVVGFVARPQADGYWLTTAAGNVYHFGAAPWRGSMAGTRLLAPIAGIAVMPDGLGYYLFGRNGSVYHFGSARFRGSAASLGLVSPVTAMAVTHTGRGYWLVTANGRVIPFGDAPYHGRARPPAGIAVSGFDSTSTDDGYWIGLDSGRVVARGAAHHGDSGGRVPARAVALVATSDDGGYWTPLADGRVLNYGSAPSRGGLHGGRFDGRVVGFDRRADDLGYWIATTAGRVFPEPGTDLPPAGIPTLTVTPVVSGLTIPWDLAFLSGGTMVFTQRGGTINAFVDGSVRTLAEPNDVVASGEGGVLGIAVDPDFAANRRIYVCFMSSVPAGGEDVRVVRYRVNGAIDDLTDRTDIVTGLPVNTTGSLGRHSGCRPRFGPDGFLWVGTGDAATGSTPQDDGSLGGKVLRVDTDGNAAPGNPGGRRWYTKGHRNVQGLAFQPGTGRAYGVEHGPDRDDEINRLVNGGNYGWNPVPGYNESVPMTDLDEFPSARVAAWSSGAPTLATSGAVFLQGEQWRDWDGALAVATLKDETLRIFRVSSDGTTVRQIAVRFGGVYGRLRSAVLSPGGTLYLTTSNGGGVDQILRVRAA